MIYPGKRTYVLETNYGCYTDYGWTYIRCFDHFCDAEAVYNDRWREIDNASYRVIDNITGEVLLGE